MLFGCDILMEQLFCGFVNLLINNNYKFYKKNITFKKGPIIK